MSQGAKREFFAELLQPAAPLPHGSCEMPLFARDERMSKSDSIVTGRTRLTPMRRRDASRRMGMVEIFDCRDRSVPWMTRTLYRLYNVQVQEILGREGISTAHWYYLRILAQGSELNQLELSKRMGIASTTAVSALDSMEKRGLLKRNRDPDDRRRHCVSLTDDGRRLVDLLCLKSSV